MLAGAGILASDKTRGMSMQGEARNANDSFGLRRQSMTYLFSGTGIFCGRNSPSGDRIPAMLAGTGILASYGI